MSDIMRPIPFSQLMNWIIEEHKTQDAIFGVRKMVTTNQEGALPIFDERIETPFGPAAGPNTQLAQNIVASYVAGSRFFEFKTVQVMDGEELSKCVNKPCIVAQDECYNCEWSTELEVPQAFAEYVKAWFACHLIVREYGLGSPDGFVFNMSVGYDLEGIKSPKVDAYIEGMKDASGSDVWNECRTWALANLDKFEHVDAAFVESIPARVSNSITESTLHGCPPAEIERIATYLITEKGLNTYIKCNPTLLGYEFARQRLNELGFDYIVFDDTHFREDLQWADAVPMFERLIALCAERGLEFGVKLTNTFPVDVTRNELPSTEMYMSGRSLFSLTIEAVRRITEQFDGKLRISYSGGATVYNIRALYDAGIWPVTLATDVLKPGGYERFSQMAGEFTDLDGKPFAGVSLDVVTAIQTDSLTNPLYKKPLRPLPDREVAGKSPLSDCFTTPCRTSCPIQQDIPAYLAAVDEGRYEDALNIIIERNALPFITGTICPHPCGRSCERAFYEPEGAQIRASKLKAAREAMTAGTVQPKPISIGMNALPFSPILRSIPSIRNAARDIYPLSSSTDRNKNRSMICGINDSTLPTPPITVLTRSSAHGATDIEASAANRFSASTSLINISTQPFSPSPIGPKVTMNIRNKMRKKTGIPRYLFVTIMSIRSETEVSLSRFFTHCFIIASINE